MNCYEWIETAIVSWYNKLILSQRWTFANVHSSVNHCVVAVELSLNLFFKPWKMGWGQGSPSSVIINNCWKKWKLYSNWICHEGLCQASTLISFLAKVSKAKSPWGADLNFPPDFFFSHSIPSPSFFLSVEAASKVPGLEWMIEKNLESVN